MLHIIFALSFSIMTTASFAKDKVPPRSWYTVLPEAQSLTTFGHTTGEAFKKKSLKALIWNIKKSGLIPWHQEFSTYSKGRDLILIQEAYANNYFKTVLSMFFNYRWDMGISFLYRRDNNTPTGTMIGSTVSPRETYVLHSPDTEPVIFTPKSLTLAKYPVKDSVSEILVISVHGINFDTTAAFKRHMDRAFLMIKDHEGPILFAGDFNTWNNSRTNYLFRLCKKFGLETVAFKNGHRRTKFNGYILDHAFVRGVKVQNAEVLGESQGSDHKPLLLEMNIL